MNLRIFEERATRSKSPKRYSLNRKIRWKERKQFSDFIEVEKKPSSPFFSCNTAENGRCGKELTSYEMCKADCREVENLHVSSAFGVPVGQDHKICLSSPVTEIMTPAPGQPYTPTDMASLHSAPVSLQPGVNASPMMPCSTVDFRIIARPVKKNHQYRFQGQTIDPSPNPSHALHYGNFQQTPNILHNETGGMITPCSSMQWNNFQESPFVPTYMTPIQSTGFQLNPVSRQGSGEAYNAFTAYGNPFGVFWSQQN